MFKKSRELFRELFGIKDTERPYKDEFYRLRERFLTPPKEGLAISRKFARKAYKHLKLVKRGDSSGKDN